MKPLSLLILAAFFGCVELSAARAQEQQVKCTSGPQALDVLAHEAAAGSTLLVVAEKAVGSKGKAAAAVLAFSAAAYSVLKDYFGGGETIACTQRNSANVVNNYVFVGNGSEPLTPANTERRLQEANIGNLTIGDRTALKKSIEELYPGLKKDIRIGDYRSSGKTLSTADLDKLLSKTFGKCSEDELKLLGRCPGSLTTRIIGEPGAAK